MSVKRASLMDFITEINGDYKTMVYLVLTGDSTGVNEANNA